jgi:hypothetical protein
MPCIMHHDSPYMSGILVPTTSLPPGVTKRNGEFRICKQIFTLLHLNHLSDLHFPTRQAINVSNLDKSFEFLSPLREISQPLSNRELSTQIAALEVPT